MTITIKKPTPTLDHIKKVAANKPVDGMADLAKIKSKVLKHKPLNPETMTGTELATKLEQIEQVLPKMTVLSDGPKGPKFEQKEIKELAKQLPKDHAKVYVEYSRKLSDGNYGSVGFTVGLQMPVGTAYHEIDEGFETACQFVDDKLSGLLNAATKKE
jgi:hypothetical protein